MDGRKVLVLCSLIALACELPMVTLLAIAAPCYGGQNNGCWIISMEAFTPALVIALALIIYFGRRTRQV